MIYFTIRILPLIFFSVNSLTYKKFKWEDLPSECGMTMHNNQNYAGTSSFDNLARIGEFPWLARIGLFDEDTDDVFFYCTGSLIHEDYVITAAHCGKQSKLVRLGEINLVSDIDCYFDTCAPSPQDIKIKQHIFAEHCRITNTNDISILVLEHPARFNGNYASKSEAPSVDDFVRPICFPREPPPRDGLINEVLVAAGWGVMYSGWGIVYRSDIVSVKDLKKVFSFVMHRDYCNNLYKRELHESELCVAYEEGAWDPCVVDSGGPLVRYLGEEKRAYIVGIASHNLELCHVGQRSAVIYTDAAYFADWMMMRLNQWIKWGA